MYAGEGAGTVGESYGRVRYMGRVPITTSKHTLFHSQVNFFRVESHKLINVLTYVAGLTCNKCLTHSILL